MSVDTLIRDARDSGIELTIVDGRVMISGKRRVVAVFEPRLKMFKAELIKRLAANDPAHPQTLEPQPSPAVDTSANTTSEVNDQLVNSPVTNKIADWQALDRAYQAHHVGCPICIAAGKGFGLRCGTGTALWAAYESADWCTATHRRNKGPTT